MSNFNTLIESAYATARKLNKATAQLKNEAPGIIIAYAKAMMALGYDNTVFSIKIFEDQETYFSTYRDYDIYRISLDFREMKFNELSDITMERDNEKMVFGGAQHDLNFGESCTTSGLLELIRELTDELSSKTNSREARISQIEGILKTEEKQYYAQ